MARIRTIKPEICTSPQLAECSRDARLLFILMLCHCDDNGIHVANPLRLKGEVFPYDNDVTKQKIIEWIEELKAAKDDFGMPLLREYKISETDTKPAMTYWQVTGFKNHQRIDQPTYKHPLPNGQVPENPARRRQEQPANKPRENDEQPANVRRTPEERSQPVHPGIGKDCKGKEDSESKDSGESPPSMWDVWVGVAGQKHRGMLGVLIKNHGDQAVAKAVAEISTMRPTPADPPAYLQAMLQDRPRWDHINKRPMRQPGKVVV